MNRGRYVGTLRHLPPDVLIGEDDSSRMVAEPCVYRCHGCGVWRTHGRDWCDECGSPWQTVILWTDEIVAAMDRLTREGGHVPLPGKALPIMCAWHEPGDPERYSCDRELPRGRPRGPYCDWHSGC